MVNSQILRCLYKLNYFKNVNKSAYFHLPSSNVTYFSAIRTLDHVLVHSKHQPSVEYQQVRYRKKPVRKPSWLPPAKSKLYFIPKTPNIEEYEFKEITRLFNNYHTSMRAIAKYFKQECQEMSDTGEITMRKAKLEQEEFEKLLKENELENERVKILRETRVADELNSQKERLLQLKENHDNWLMEKKEEIEKLVKREKKLSKTYVTMENLDEAVEKALDETVNYNFAIDLNGKILWESVPHPEASPYWTETNESTSSIEQK